MSRPAPRAPRPTASPTTGPARRAVRTAGGGEPPPLPPPFGRLSLGRLSTRPLSIWLLSLGLLIGLALGAAVPTRAAEGDPPLQTTKSTAKVVVIGFDGADARLVEQYMDAGLLPNLDRLRREGSFAPLGTTTPPQTPVSWSAFATGRNPGRNGIFDFLSRDIRTYQPGYAMFDVGERRVGLGKRNGFLGGGVLALLLAGVGALLFGRARGPLRAAPLVLALVGFGAGYAFTARYVPVKRPTIVNKVSGQKFWERAADNGKKCRIIRVPAMFPAEKFANGEIQSGLGVPDLRGTTGTYQFYTTENRTGSEGDDTEKGGKIEQVAFVNGETTAEIWGPRNKLYDSGPTDIKIPLTIKIDRKATPPTVTVTASGSTLTLKEGEWSHWVRLKFPFNPFIAVQGIARFHLASVEPFGLYISPVNIDPDKPVIPVSAPAKFSAWLAQKFGLYKTLGWENDTFALDENVIDEEAFMADVKFSVDTWIPMMDHLLTDPGLDLYVHVFDFTDRVGHMFWRTIDPTHPAADSLADLPYRNIMPDTYRRMDDIVGRVRAQMDDKSMLIICSDHGFNTWHKSVNYNTWLVRNGFMVLKNDTPDKTKTLEDLFGQGQFWPNVDWSKTRAYAMGLGDLYVNLKGREAHGSVDPVDYEGVRDSLIAGLEAFVDTANGEHPVRHVRRREEVYKGFDENVIPDLFVANNAGYRVSWQTSLGGIPPQLFEINKKKWSGDHCSLDPEITKGIFFSNRRFDLANVNILDIYPTICRELGVSLPEDLDGRELAPRN